MTVKLGPIPRISMSLAITVFGIVTACRRDVPGHVPTTPSPLTPEVTRKAPKPGKIDPSHVETGADASSSFGHGRATLRVADAPRDASVSDVYDLPPVPDADVHMVRDAGQPLHR